MNKVLQFRSSTAKEFFIHERTRNIPYEAVSAPIVRLTAHSDDVHARSHYGEVDLPSSAKNAIVVVNRNIPSKQQITRVVSDKYKVVQHHNLIDDINTGLSEAIPRDKSGGAYANTHYFDDGTTMTREIIFPEMKGAIDVNSRLGYRIIIRNSHGDSGIHLITGAIDFYCTNGMIIGSHIEKERWQHSKNFNIDNVVKRIKQSIHEYNEFLIEAERLSQTSAPRNLRVFLEDCGMGPRQIARVRERMQQEVVDHGYTMWGLLSAITHDTTHRSFSDRQRGRQDLVRLTRQENELKIRESSAWREAVSRAA